LKKLHHDERVKRKAVKAFVSLIEQNEKNIVLSCCLIIIYVPSSRRHSFEQFMRGVHIESIARNMVLNGGEGAYLEVQSDKARTVT
jgi:hypothetical protein